MVRRSERAGRLLQHVNFRPGFHSIYRHTGPLRMRASCHAQLAAPACMTDSHRMSPTTCPRFSARIRQVIAARIHARVLCDFPIGNFMMLLPASIDLIGILIECQMHVNTVLIRME